jgi:hypothetical protein
MLLPRKDLRHTISRHLVRGSPLYVKTVCFDLLADPALVNVDVFKLCTEFVLLFCNYPYSLLIVTPNNRRLVKLQRESIKEAAPLFHF